MLINNYSQNSNTIYQQLADEKSLLSSVDKNDKSTFEKNNTTDTANNPGISRYRVFKTEAEASYYLEYIKAEETLRKAIAEANQGWMPDWNTHIEDKWCITIEAGLSKLSETCVKSFKHHPTFMYIRSGKLATYLMNKYRKEFITYLSY